MPNLVVYVPADVARALEVNGVSQDIQRRACKEVLSGLAAGDGGAVAPRREGSSGFESQSAAPGSKPSSAVSPRLNQVSGFSPDATKKKCVRFQRHHVNHSGAPCPECGYPNGEKD